jgi:hypothetical protein
VPQLLLVVLRLLAEPLGDLVLDAALRQPQEDARVPKSPPSRHIEFRIVAALCCATAAMPRSRV